jgi:L-ornithine Nalpha-acyltransferase
MPLVVNSLEVRLAEGRAEREAAQNLRYRVFYDEMCAQPSAAMKRLERDFDKFDAICDHLLVIDRDRAAGASGVVGTYRFLRRSIAEQQFGFYSADEYDLSPLSSYPGEIMELGRSCVDKQYRSRAVMQLLWRGIANYIAAHKVELMFGCASFPGTDVESMANALSFLRSQHLAPAHMRPRALTQRLVRMDRLPPAQINAEAAQRELPPLVKGYLRLGGWVGDGAVIDHQFNTTDICILVETDQVTDKYHRHYRVEPRRSANLEATALMG